MRKFAGRRRTDAEPHAASPPMTALVVDDETSYRTYVTSIAEKVGFTTDAAADGNAALSMLSNSRYDLLLVNVETNGINGLELIAQVRADEATRTAYTIVTTSGDELEKKIQALTPEQIVAALRKHIDPKKLVIVTAGDFETNTSGAGE